MRYGYAAVILKNSPPFDPEWQPALDLAVELLEREQRKIDDAEDAEYEEIDECN